MNTTMVVSLLVLAIAVITIGDSIWLEIRLQVELSRPRIGPEISRSTCLDAEGKERVSWSFNYGHPATALDRFRLARARRRFNRLSRDDRSAA